MGQACLGQDQPVVYNHYSPIIKNLNFHQVKMHANKYPSNVTLCGNVQMMELNNDDIYSPLCDVDPDANYFN